MDVMVMTFCTPEHRNVFGNISVFGVDVGLGRGSTEFMLGHGIYACRKFRAVYEKAMPIPLWLFRRVHPEPFLNGKSSEYSIVHIR
jgi:hypothetical protein